MMTALDTAETNNMRQKYNRITKTLCSTKLVKNRLPILKWLPKYNTGYLIQDSIAGLTVGLTSIPQGIAYAVIAGLPAEHGLYASLTAGLIYAIFGSCKDVSIGPTAILSALTAKYVSSYSADFAILATLFTGIIILTMGILQLGFLIDFISAPVVSGFTTAAAIQIATSQLKSFFGLDGSSGNYFLESIYNFVVNIKTIKLWDTLLSTSTIILLIFLKNIGKGCSRQDVLTKKLRWFLSLGRNAVVVVLGMIIAYNLKIFTDDEPLTLIGEISGGLPTFGLPPFSTTLGNETYSFRDMMEILGPKSVVLPFVAVLEIIAIAKVFAEGSKVDATQEMIALGLCNVIGSFCQSMPITAAFTRTTLNHVSGAQTPAVGIATVLLITLALTCLTSTFYYIPKATLAAMIVMAVVSMIDISIFSRLWSNCKRELPIVIITMLVGLFCGLEYGITAGILFEAVILLYRSSKPAVDVSTSKTHNGDLVIIKLPTSLSYCGAEHIRKIILRSSVHNNNSAVIIDGTNLQNMDTTVASNLVSVVKNIEKATRGVFLINFREAFMKICESINPKCINMFVNNVSLLDLNDIIVRRG